MEKIQFIDLGPSNPEEPISQSIGATKITIQKTVPYEQLFNNIEWAVNYIVDDRPFISAPLRKVITDLALLRSFTNLDFSKFDSYELSAQEIYEIYDILMQFDAVSVVKDAANPEQVAFLESTIIETCQALIQYRNSAVGIVDIISAKSANTNEVLEKSLSFLKDTEELQHVSKILDLMDAPNTGTKVTGTKATEADNPIK